MEKIFSILIFCCLLSNCSDDDQATMATTSTTLASKPEANSLFDNSHKGIYKGIVIGNTSGVLYVDLYNDDKIWAKFQTENNETYILENVPILGGDGKDILPIYRYHFANDNISFEIQLNESGGVIATSNFNFYSSINSKICLIKEKSNSLVKCYTGRFESQDESGNVNFTTDGELKVKGLSKEFNSRDFIDINGEIKLFSPTDEISTAKDNRNPFTQYQLNANLHIGQITGLMEKNKFNGNWTYADSNFGIWNATRIL